MVSKPLCHHWSLVIGYWFLGTDHRLPEWTQCPFLENGPAFAESLLLGITIFAFAIIIIGLLISTFFLVVSRFYKNIYGRQGYLTMTLPVNSHQLILSKLVAALIWYFIASLVILLSGFIIAGISLSQQMPSMADFVNEAWTQFNFLISLYFLDGILFFFSIFINTVLGILLSYFAISWANCSRTTEFFWLSPFMWGSTLCWVSFRPWRASPPQSITRKSWFQSDRTLFYWYWIF